ncbi:MAG TPA: hypothetical protein VNC84_00250 [Gammaproteobacteria bacterium]|jgi:hypothetical protein|nr:hypothetical protein [Gammaproteobacteria bacterium]
MEDKLKRLEVKLRELISHQNSLNQTNQVILREKETLLESQQKTIRHIETLIAKLREANL